MNGVLLAAGVAVGGGLGAVARFEVDSRVRARWAATVPWATLLINVSASLLLGLLAGGATAGSVSPDLLSLAGTGFCGGYSTFSTAAVELLRPLETRQPRAAVGYATATLVLPILAAAAGFQLAQ